MWRVMVVMVIFCRKGAIVTGNYEMQEAEQGHLLLGLHLYGWQ